MCDVIKRDHRSLIEGTTKTRQKRYWILKDYRGTYIEKVVTTEEQMAFPIFRVFEAAKPDRDRKLNIDPTHSFDPYNDSLMDYASIIGHKLGKPWKFFNRLIAVHVPLCPNDCWHCYLPHKLYVGKADSATRSEPLTSEDIVDRFLIQRTTDYRNDKHSNVLRITGGEPFLLPELIVECLRIIRKRGLEEDVFVWTETNLEPFMGKPGEAFMDLEENKRILDELSNFKNFLVHPCFHGLDQSEFKMITSRGENISLDDQVDAIKRLFDANIDIYPTYGSNVCNPRNAKNLYKKLSEINPQLPLRIALIEYKFDYPPVENRVKKIGRVPPKLYSKFANFRIWNQLLLENFEVGYGVIPRHLISFDPNTPIKPVSNSLSNYISSVEEQIFFFKSSFRDLYHREILDLLALPKDSVIEVTYEKEHIQSDLFFHMSYIKTEHIGKKGIWFYVNTDGDTILPLRECEIIDIKRAGDIISIVIKLYRYLSFPNSDVSSLSKKVTINLNKYFSKKTTPPMGADGHDKVSQ
jgi:uncharacterized Fe-S cluster-containing radical SAM superfamily protein